MLRIVFVMLLLLLLVLIIVELAATGSSRRLDESDDVEQYLGVNSLREVKARAVVEEIHRAASGRR